jgi:competence protein ComQ
LEPRVLEECHAILDRYVDEPDLRRLLDGFLEEKSRENSIWAKITIQVHHMFGGESATIYHNAALTELLMLAYDIVDDLQDHDNPTKSWMACPMENTLNGILAFLIACMAELPEPSAPAAARLLASSVNGQHLDLAGSITTEQEYLDMVSLKSGSLIRFACMMGYSLIPRLDEERVRQIDQLAGLIGIIAQLANDVRDVTRIDEKNDLLFKKKTLPILFLLEHAEEECPVLSDYYNGRISEEVFVAHKKEIVAFISASGCLEYSRVIQTLYIEKADEIFASLPALPPWKEAFRTTTICPSF